MKISRVRIVFLMLISLSLVMLAASVQAAPPVGQWNIVYYADDGGLSPVITDAICFEGGPSKGTWYSPTFAGWGGSWWRKGGSSDVIMFDGNWNSGAGNTAAKVDLISLSLMAGSLMEWFDDTASNWYQVRLNKQKTVCDPPAVGMSATTHRRN